MVSVTLTGISEPAARRALHALAALWGVRLDSPQSEGAPRAAGLIMAAGSREGASSLPDDDRPALVFAAGAGSIADGGGHVEVNFARHAGIPPFLRGQSLLASEPIFNAVLPAGSASEIGADVAGRPIWRLSGKAGRTRFVVATPPPLLQEGQRLSEILNGETFLHALPAWLFFRELAAAPRWTPPPLRACLVVDDPNLHRPGYGHIDYLKLVGFARANPFHAAMATVPLDGWWVDAATARIFRDNAAVLSLLVHGNDHLHHELARPFSPDQQHALVRQSLERTAAIERRAGFAVDRVMAPPHGVCSPGMMEWLWRAGFAGMTSNRWSLWKHSPAATLPEDSGFRPADILAGGLPVVPRFRFNSGIGRNEIVLAALFGQPIVPYGHHQDFSEDMAAVRKTVTAVNALGPVKWMSMREILETNYEQLAESGTLRLRLFSRHIKGVLPAGATHLQVELAPSVPSAGETLVIDWHGAGISGHATVRPGEPTAVPAGCQFEVRWPVPTLPRGTTALPAKPSVQVLLRRLASEARDRLRLQANADHTL